MMSQPCLLKDIALIKEIVANFKIQVKMKCNVCKYTDAHTHTHRGTHTAVNKSVNWKRRETFLYKLNGNSRPFHMTVKKLCM